MNTVQLVRSEYPALNRLRVVAICMEETLETEFARKSFREILRGRKPQGLQFASQRFGAASNGSPLGTRSSQTCEELGFQTALPAERAELEGTQPHPAVPLGPSLGWVRSALPVYGQGPVTLTETSCHPDTCHALVMSGLELNGLHTLLSSVG